MVANASFAGEGDCLAAGQSCTTLLTARGESPGVAPRPARRPDGKARRLRISGIFEGGATQPDGMQRRPNGVPSAAAALGAPNPAGLSPRAVKPRSTGTEPQMLSRDQVLALMRERVHHPAGTRELLQILKIPKDERTSFKRHVKSLVSSGDLIHIRGHRFGLPEKMDLYVGRLQTHQAGYGFVAPERPLDGGGDIYISGPHLNEAMHGDRVVVRIERIKEGGRAEGRIIRILERRNEWIVGRYDRGDAGMGYVVPFDRRVLMDIFVPPGPEGGASPGDMVVVELTRWATPTRGAIGRVAEVLGDIDAPGVDTEIIIRKYGIPDAHSNEATTEAVRL